MQPLVTVCLLNYHRPGNIIHVLNTIEMQTVPTQVFLWNNSDDELPQHPSLKMVVNSSRNLGCFPRWWLASIADTEYVCSLDDDLVFKDENVLADTIAASRDKCPDGATGFFGWRHIEGRGYRASRNVYNSKEDQWADIIKGRFMLFRRALLEKVPMDITTMPAFGGLFRGEDDIYISLCLADGHWGKHLVPGILRKRWRNLQNHRDAWSSKPNHYVYRDESIKAIQSWLEKRKRQG